MSILLTTETALNGDANSENTSRTSYLIREGQSLVVGRDRESCDIVIETDSALSRAHFRVTCAQGGAKINDSGSRHGTFVNGQQITESELSEGDQIAAAETRFLVESVADPELPGGSDRKPNEQSKPFAKKDSGRSVTLRILKIVSGSNGQRSSCWLFVTLLPTESVTLGRVVERVEVPFPDDSLMSGRHIEFSFQRGQCRAVDLNSSNGSFLNGLRFNNELLQDGDEVQMGTTYVLVKMKRIEGTGPSSALQTVGNLFVSRGDKEKERLKSRGYQIVNSTPFPLVPLTGRIGFPGHSLTLIVKATVDLVPDGVMTVADEQLPPTGDQPFPDADDPAIPPRYESDFAFRKPSSDVFVAGHCHAPGGEPVTQLHAAVHVGDLAAEVSVIGERFWELQARDWKATEPVPFTSLPMTPVYAYGGADFSDNPGGIGYYPPNMKQSDKPLPLARIVPPGAVSNSPVEQMEVVGLTPAGKWYGRRRSQLGTYDEAWEKQRWPWFPADFDWGHFNAAMKPLPVGSFLKGDEEVVLKNLHKTHSELRSHLPALRVRLFVNPSGQPFREVTAKLDTLCLDTDNDQAVLVWRGNTAVRSEECEEIRHLFVLSQPMDEPLLSVDECHARLLNEVGQRKQEFVPPPESPSEGEVEETDESSEADDFATSAETAAAAKAAASADAEFQKLHAEIKAAQIEAGVDPAQFDKQVDAEVARLAKEWGLDSGIVPAGFEHQAAMEFWSLQKQIHDAQVASGVEPIPLPPAPEEPDEQAETTEEEETGWTREKVEAHHRIGGDFTGQVLSELDLSGLDLSGSTFKAAILTKAKLVGTILAEADFTLANLSEADLSEANLTKATLTHADCSKAIFHKASLDEVQAGGAIMAGAWLTAASMKNAKAERACFSYADLTGAVFDYSRLDNADFSKARLTRASFLSGSLVSARLESTSAREARFDFADMTKVRATESDCVMATFHQVTAPNSIWELANLVACDFTWAILTKANFTKATLNDARLMAANLAGARLTKSAMRRVLMTDANLFEANLQKADLKYANLTGSSFYGAETFEATFDHSVQDEVNWKMTKQGQEQAS